jgi:hypothetical protein
MVFPVLRRTVNNEQRTVAARFSDFCAKPGLAKITADWFFQFQLFDSNR